MSKVATNNLLKALQVEYREHMNELSDHVSCGGCKDMNEYSRCVGVIEGLAYAERALLNLNERLERE
jgi:hypothetical protein